MHLANAPPIVFVVTSQTVLDETGVGQDQLVFQIHICGSASFTLSLEWALQSSVLLLYFGPAAKLLQLNQPCQSIPSLSFQAL